MAEKTTAEKTTPRTPRTPRTREWDEAADTVTIGAESAQPALDAENERIGATTTDPAARARAADAGVKVDPTTGRVSERGPVGESLPREERLVARRPLFVRVGSPVAGDSRRLVGEDTPDEGSLVLYLPGDPIPAEHRDLPTVAAVHRHGVWEPEGT